MASNPRMNTTNRKICFSVAYLFAAVIFMFFVVGSIFYSFSQSKVVSENMKYVPRLQEINSPQQNESIERSKAFLDDIKYIPGVEEIGGSWRKKSIGCNKLDKPKGCETLPKRIITEKSDLQMKPLFGPSKIQKIPKNLLAIGVGIKQKKFVNQIITKFLASGFHVMMFHYDGTIDEWRTFPWCDQAIHVSAKHQTKWWFAKRFLHPDIVSKYSYIFLWDEDLGVENFHPGRYLDIIRKEGLEISQPALDGSNIHHRITARQRRKKFHTRFHKLTGGGGRCDENSTGPPCTGWVEMMAPVFSKAAWRCTWHMIQNDLIHAWGLDYRLGYCAQGDRTKKIGVVDAEYVVHKGIPSLGGFGLGKGASGSSSSVNTTRYNVRMQSYAELKMFDRRWKEAEKQDKCWSDPFSKNM